MSVQGLFFKSLYILSLLLLVRKPSPSRSSQWFVSFSNDKCLPYLDMLRVSFSSGSQIHVEVSALATSPLLSSNTMTTAIYRSAMFRLPVLES